MLLIHDAREFPPSARSGVLCVGNFDGVHAGHARMLQEGRRIAAQTNRPFVIMTFDPHPMSVLKPSLPRPPLMTLEQRIEALSVFSPAVLLMVQTNREFLAISAEESCKRLCTIF